MIFIKKIFKRDKGKWSIVNKKELGNLSEDDLRNIVIVTTNNRKFKLKEVMKNE